jgi:hypothetical protein
MKVFEFSYDVDYGGGVMLIGANSLEKAEEIANAEPTGFGHWVFAWEHASLEYKGEKESVILKESWAE